MSSAKKSILANTAIITAIVMISKLFGFMREAIIAYTFGAGMETDAFYMASGIVGLLTGVVLHCFSAVFLPMYSEIKIKKGRFEADKYASNIINIIFVFSFILTMIGLVFAPQIMRLLAPGFPADKLILTVKIARIFLAFGALTVTIGYFSALLNANEKFLTSQLIGLPLTLFCIAACMIFSNRQGIFPLVWACIIAYIAQILMQVLPLRRIYTHRLCLDFKDEKLKRTVLIGLPSVVTVLVGNLANIIDRTLSSGLAEGSVASLRYASHLTAFVTGLLVSPLATVLLTKFSVQSAHNDKAEMSATFGRGAMFIVATMLPITAISMIDSTDIVKMAYARGSFEAAAVSLTAIALRFYALEFVFTGFKMLLTYVLISLKDTRSLMVVGILGMAIDIILNFILIGPMGIAGLALSSSISIAFVAVLQLIIVRRKLGSLGLRYLLGQLAKIAFATIVCSAVTILLVKYMPFERPIYRFACCAALGLGSYALSALALKVEAACEALDLANTYFFRFASKLRRG